MKISPKAPWKLCGEPREGASFVYAERLVFATRCGRVVGQFGFSIQGGEEGIARIEGREESSSKATAST
jgi:hypothetical protein